jgi:hypothetical protein
MSSFYHILSTLAMLLTWLPKTVVTHTPNHLSLNTPPCFETPCLRAVEHSEV